MPSIADYILNLALTEFDTATTTLWLCNAQPTTYVEASSAPATGFALGSKTGLDIGATAAGSPNGRQVTIASFNNGSVSASGTATHWAITKDNTTLMATGSLAASQAVVSGNSFTLPAFVIRIAAPT